MSRLHDMRGQVQAEVQFRAQAPDDSPRYVSRYYVPRYSDQRFGVSGTALEIALRFGHRVHLGLHQYRVAAVWFDGPGENAARSFVVIDPFGQLHEVVVRPSQPPPPPVEVEEEVRPVKFTLTPVQVGLTAMMLAHAARDGRTIEARGRTWSFAGESRPPDGSLHHFLVATDDPQARLIVRVSPQELETALADQRRDATLRPDVAPKTETPDAGPKAGPSQLRFDWLEAEASPRRKRSKGRP